MNVIFRNNIQRALWCIEYVPSIGTIWKSSGTQMEHSKWFSANVVVGGNVGTDIPEWVPRYRLHKNVFLDARGYALLAIARYEIFIGGCTPEIAEILDLMIKVDLRDSNRDYRIVQVKTKEETLRILTEPRMKVLQGLVKTGVTLESIIEALTNNDFTTAMLNKEIKDMNEITRDII